MLWLDKINGETAWVSKIIAVASIPIAMIWHLRSAMAVMGKSVKALWWSEAAEAGSS